MTKNTEEKLKLLIDFYETKGRWPKAKESYKGVKIGPFACGITYGNIMISDHYFALLSEMEFFTDYFHKKIIILLDFLNTNKRYPYTNEIYRDFNIYQFAYSIKNGKLNKHISDEDKNTLSKNIYFNSTYKQSIFHKRTLLLIEFYDLYGRWPKVKETFKGEKIGSFAYETKRHRKHLWYIDENLLKDKGFPFK